MPKSGAAQSRQQQCCARQRRALYQREYGQRHQVADHAAKIGPTVPSRGQPKRQQHRAGEGADAVHGRQQADAFRAQMQAVAPDDRDHAGEGPGEQIVDHGDDQHADQPAIVAHQSKPLADARQHGAGSCGGGMRERMVRTPTARCRTSARSGLRRPEGRCRRGESRRGPGRSCGVALLAPTSSDIAVPIFSRPTTSPIMTRRTGLSVDQPNPLRKLATARCQTSSCPAISRTASKADVPLISSTTMNRVRPRSNLSAQRAEKDAEQTHRKQPQHGHHRDQKSRIGALVDDNADRDGFQPAHGGDHQADIPQAPEVRGLDDPPERRASHGIASSFGDCLPLTLALLAARGTRQALFNKRPNFRKEFLMAVSKS